MSFFRKVEKFTEIAVKQLRGIDLKKVKRIF